MKRVVLIAAVLLFPVTALAADETQSLPEGIVIASRSANLFDAQAAQTSPQTRPPAPRGSGSMRRPSMVGYIEDSTIGSRIRVRFDAAQHLHAPDRAEFFYAKCGWYNGLAVNSPMYDPDAPGPLGGIATDLNARQLFVLGEYGVMANRASLFVELPVRWLRPQAFAIGGFGDTSGLADLRFGGKLGVVDSDRGHATLLVRVTAPTGDARKGLSTHHASIEPAFIVSQALHERIGLEGQFGAVFPTSGSAGIPTSASEQFSGRVLYYGIGPSFDVYSSGPVTLSPVVELVGWRLLSGFQTSDPNILSGPRTGFAEVSDVVPNIVNLKFGARLTMRDVSSIYVGYGKHITKAGWYDDIFRIEYRVGVGR